jgi:hypothetical protein
MAIAVFEQGREKAPAVLIMHQMVAENAAGLVGIGMATTPSLQVCTELSNGPLFATKAAPSPPINEIRMAIRLP